MGCINCKLLSKLKSFFRFKNFIKPENALEKPGPSTERESGTEKTEKTEKVEKTTEKIERTETSVSIGEKRDMVGPLNTVQNSCAVCEDLCLGNCDDNLRVEEPDSRLEFSRISNDPTGDMGEPENIVQPTESIRPNSPENEWQSV